ncbi:hypothetical protein AS029_06390 [Microbacterium enclense]|nr:hypothetical protein AS029_06390 [Microbacterium enclense]
MAAVCAGSAVSAVDTVAGAAAMAAACAASVAPPRVIGATVTYGSRAASCLATVGAMRAAGVETVVVVDNGSVDDARRQLDAYATVREMTRDTRDDLRCRANRGEVGKSGSSRRAPAPDHGQPPSEPASVEPTSVRWKFSAEREAVGPRWPW